MNEENLVTAFATVENGTIVIPKVYLPDGISLKAELHLGKSLEIAFFPDEPDDVCEQYTDCQHCPQYNHCKYELENA
ncbi:MAG: hypothetical protein Q4D37_04995 [Oscillospiraceae bacterium]|nr:hypothetical protein [Oscillospiraceae bacterium]